MPRQNITDLALPDFQFRPDMILISGFEKLDAVRAEDHIRAKMLGRFAISPNSPCSPRKHAKAKRVAERLRQALSENAVNQSMASAVYMREFRIRAVGHLWRLATESEDPSTFTAWGRGMEVEAKDLSRVDPRAMANAFKADIYRAGATAVDGYIFAFLDAEYEPTGDVFKFHWHGLVDGDLKDILENLRKTRKYGEPKAIRVSRKPLVNLPEPLTYLIKLFWGSRWEGQIDGEKKRQRQRSRIKEPRHSELLLWLDRWSPNDLAVLIGLEVVGGQLVKTSKK